MAGLPMARDPNQMCHGGSVGSEEFQNYISHKKSMVLKKCRIFNTFLTVKKSSLYLKISLNLFLKLILKKKRVKKC